jgi:hypothetical protein
MPFKAIINSGHYIFSRRRQLFAHYAGPTCSRHFLGPNSTGANSLHPPRYPGVFAILVCRQLIDGYRNDRRVSWRAGGWSPRAGESPRRQLGLGDLLLQGRPPNTPSQQTKPRCILHLFQHPVCDFAAERQVVRRARAACKPSP